VVVADPVGDGFVQSLARPGGNITGFSTSEPSLGGKWLQLLKEIGQVGVIFNPNTAPDGGSSYFHLIETAAASMAVKVTPASISDDKTFLVSLRPWPRRETSVSLSCRI
jgi:putative ABC transport system substrate-binding protein